MFELLKRGAFKELPFVLFDAAPAPRKRPMPEESVAALF